MSERKSRTLFVRNLPFTASNEKLLEVFEQVGPVKTAFVVADKGQLTFEFILFCGHLIILVCTSLPGPTQTCDDV